MVNCTCGQKAVWVYMPTGDQDRYFCEDCVPRGCGCEHEYVDMEAYGLSGENFPRENTNWKWIDEGKIWCRLDSAGREQPCCEFFYSEEGFENEM